MAPARPDPIAHLTGALRPTPHPSGIGLPREGEKFDTAGSVQIWRGNTFVSHVTRSSPSYEGMLDLQERVKRSEFARFFTFLPPPSFHMTIFQGYSPRLETTEIWPKDVPATDGPDTATAIFAERVHDLALPTYRARPTDLFCLNSLTMAGATQEDERILRTARETLRTLTGIRPDDFDDYVFHLSMAYLVQWVSASTAREIVDFSDELGAQFCADFPEVELDPCAFCAFDSMHHFEPVRVIPWQTA